MVFNMLSILLPVFCIFLVSGSSFAREKITPEVMQNAHSDCKAEGYVAPSGSEDARDSKFACFFKCFLEKLGTLQGEELVLADETPNRTEIIDCFNKEKIGKTNGCDIVSAAMTCMWDLREF